MPKYLPPIGRLEDDPSPKLSADLDANSKKIKNLGAPVDDNDAARKVDVFLDKFIILPTGSFPFNTGEIKGVNNVVYCTPIFLQASITVNKIWFEVTAYTTGKYASVGIYSADGNTLLIDSKHISTSTAGIKSKTLDSPITLPAGVYILALTANAVSIGIRGVDIATLTSLNTFANFVTNRMGSGANASSDGRLPETIGAITSSVDDRNFPVVVISTE